MNEEYQNDPTADTAVNGMMEGKWTFKDAGPQGDVQIVVKASLGDGAMDVRNLKSGGPFQLPHPEIPGAKFTPDALTLERAASEGRMYRIQKVDAEVFLPEYDDDEAAAKEPIAKAKRDLIRALVERGVGGGDPKLSRHVGEIWRELGFTEEFGERPDTRTVRSWLGKGDPLTISVAELMSRSGKGPRKPRLRPEVSALLDASADHFYSELGLRPRDSVVHLEKGIKAANKDRPAHDQLKAPSRETLRKRIAEMLTPENYERKFGKTARQKNFGGFGVGLQATRIGQLGLMDDTVIDGMACFDAVRGLPAGRPNLCFVVDVASRCIVGYFLSFSPPTACTAVETLKAASAYNRVPKELLESYPVLERINCSFEELVVDRGSNYTSLAFGQAMLDVGTTLRFARLRRARDKAIIERVFHTLKTFLLEKLPGATFAPKLMREFGYDPQTTACLTITELRELIELFIAVYHVTVHSGIGTQPALFWARSLAEHGRRLITNRENYGILLGETIYGVQMHRWGFTLDGIRYTHPVNVELALTVLAGAQAVGTADDFCAKPTDLGKSSKGRRRKSRSAGLGNNSASANVKVKRNTANLVRVHAWIPGHGWLPFDAANAAYADGLSLHQHQQIGKWAKARNMAFSTEADQLAARASLIARVAELAPEMPLRERRAVARMVEGSVPEDMSIWANVVIKDDVIEAETCDERDDPMPTPKSMRGSIADEDGATGAKLSDAENKTKAMLDELSDLGWERYAGDDEIMEEHS